jgi:hypothetical protein
LWWNFRCKSKRNLISLLVVLNITIKV